MRTILNVALPLLLVLGGSALAVAADGGTEGDDASTRSPDTYGTKDGNDHWLAPTDFHPGNGEHPTWISNYGWVWNSSGSQEAWHAHLRLPSGASIAGYRVYYSDSDPDEDIHVVVARYLYDRATQNDGLDHVGSDFWSSGTPGQVSGWANFNPRVTYTTRSGSIDSFYEVIVYMPPSYGVQFRGVRIEWYHQVSPAPETATFADVPTGYWAFQHVEALAASGITAGCGGGNFCPEASLTRAQMAVFLAKALGLHYPGRVN